MPRVGYESNARGREDLHRGRERLLLAARSRALDLDQRKIYIYKFLAKTQSYAPMVERQSLLADEACSGICHKVDRGKVVIIIEKIYILNLVRKLIHCVPIRHPQRNLSILILQ